LDENGRSYRKLGKDSMKMAAAVQSLPRMGRKWLQLSKTWRGLDENDRSYLILGKDGMKMAAAI